MEGRAKDLVNHLSNLLNTGEHVLAESEKKANPKKVADLRDLTAKHAQRIIRSIPKNNSDWSDRIMVTIEFKSHAAAAQFAKDAENLGIGSSPSGNNAADFDID